VPGAGGFGHFIEALEYPRDNAVSRFQSILFHEIKPYGVDVEESIVGESKRIQELVIRAGEVCISHGQELLASLIRTVNPAGRNLFLGGIEATGG
jgi:hypothetical protein